MGHSATLPDCGILVKGELGSALLLSGKGERLPKINSSPKDRMIKARRHYSDDAHCLSIQLQLATHNTWIASKMTLPEPIAEHDDIVDAGLKFLRVEKTT